MEGKKCLTHVRIDKNTNGIASEVYVCDSLEDALKRGEEMMRRIFTTCFGYDEEDVFIDESVADFKANKHWDDETDVMHMLFVKVSNSNDEVISFIADEYARFCREHGNMKPNYALVKVTWDDGSIHTDAICLEDGNAPEKTTIEDDDILYYCSDLAHLLNMCIPDNGESEFHVSEVLSFDIV